MFRSVKSILLMGAGILLVLCLVCGCGDNSAADKTIELDDKGDPISPVAPGAAGEGVHYGEGKPKELREYPWYVRDSLMPQQSKQFESAGFSMKELRGYEIGNVFSIFVFDADGQLLPEETVMACPIIADQKYMGKAVVTYDERTNQMSKELHKDTLLADITGGTVDTTAVLTLGKVGSKTFVTDGVDLDILAVDETPHPDDMTDDQLKALSATFKAAAGEKYNYVCGYFISVQDVG